MHTAILCLMLLPRRRTFYHRRVHPMSQCTTPGSRYCTHVADMRKDTWSCKGLDSTLECVLPR